MTVTPQFPDEQLDGEFVRQDDAFRAKVEPAAERYHLYVSLACPWAHRTIIMRKLKGLEDAIGMTIVDPVRDERGWRFTFEPDPVNGFAFLSEAYFKTDPGYRGRVTVPVLWDKRTGKIANNSDDDILRMFETEFDALAKHNDVDYYPARHRAEIDALNAEIYENVNNGVYRAGFATSQDAYERAAREVFAALDGLDERLASRRYLFGSMPVETDWRLFVTLVRFDAVYYGHFKCNVRRIVDYPNIWPYVCDLYQFRGVGTTVDLNQIKTHYYFTHDDINPTRIIPIGPLLNFDAPHGRERLG
ncbi:MAG TPA: glutathione S-transferase family protein [Candidatus Acidoferrales bacterium]|nr:glutathione S-transferase family protein [Candidatus Acidoferrales bacterium]